MGFVPSVCNSDGDAMARVTRRNFITSAATRWSTAFGLLGFRFSAYANPAATGWRGWIEWCGRAVGYVRLNGEILWRALR